MPDGPLGDLHRRLRDLHRDAGLPGAPHMAAKTDYTHSTMRRLMVDAATPRWPVLLAALVRLCPLAQWPLEPTIREFHRLFEAVTSDASTGTDVAPAPVLVDDPAESARQAGSTSARALVVGVNTDRAGLVDAHVSELGDVLLELNGRRTDRVHVVTDLPAADVEPTLRRLSAVIDPPDEQLVHLIGPGAHGSRSVYFAATEPADGLHLGAFLERLEDVKGPNTLVLLDIAVSASDGTHNPQRWRLLSGHDGRVAVLGVVIPGQPQLLGRFSEAVAVVLRRLHQGTLPIHPREPFVPLSYLRDAIRRELTLTPGKAPLPAHFFVDDVPVGNLEQAKFVLNRRYRPDNGVRLELAQDDEARAFLDELAAEAPALDPGHYFGRAAGRPGADVRSPVLFSGREAELSTLQTWLDEQAPATALRVVTGQPGAGKSALLGMIVCAAHPSLAALRVFGSARRQPPGTFAAAHARGLLVQEVVRSIAVQLGLGREVRAASELLAALAARPADAAVPSIVIDALDEATAPREHLDLLLLPLAALERATAPGRPACRLLVGTRPWPEFEQLIRRATATGGLCDLDEVPWARQRDELSTYLSRRLQTPFFDEHAFGEADAETLARRIADNLTDPRRNRAARGGPFLVAVLHAHRLMRAASRPGADPMSLRVPAHLGEVLELDLAARSPDRLLRPMLVALAQARGAGIPERLLRDTTATMATAFQRRSAPQARRIPRPSEDRIADLLASVSFYLRRSPGPDGTTHYRFFHQALSDYMTEHPGGPSEDWR
ncbi:ATP-binding protein [Pseudosporangium ferrugineum]|uniref:ATP-binding protein n=1 Tax=Pseudosporangium ferrugineum TaxID=439699 RepID=UPI0011B1C83A|nr:ATP-binding protein [Pseudosporangium ferrugineum]